MGPPSLLTWNAKGLQILFLWYMYHYGKPERTLVLSIYMKNLSSENHADLTVPSSIRFLTVLFLDLVL